MNPHEPPYPSFHPTHVPSSVAQPAPRGASASDDAFQFAGAQIANSHIHSCVPPSPYRITKNISWIDPERRRSPVSEFFALTGPKNLQTRRRHPYMTAHIRAASIRFER